MERGRSYEMLAHQNSKVLLRLKKMIATLVLLFFLVLVLELGNILIQFLTNIIPNLFKMGHVMRYTGL
ncbi:hypothetical protein O9929_08405 [Vibrio lentus]|nr:hypothetical protein [Vibrio lentus]